jgi:glycogenin glucosyltransferase
VEPIHSASLDNLQLLGRPELFVTFTKLRLWNLTEYSKVVFLDADTLAIQNVDDLFSREDFSAVADVGWPDCFNSGLFVTRPSKDTFQKLSEMAIIEGSFDGSSGLILFERRATSSHGSRW